MVRYRSTPEGWKNLDTGAVEPYPNRVYEDGFPCPGVVSDIQPIKSPVDGKMITSRSQLAYELEKHGKRIQEPDESPTKGKIRNKKFADKRGLPVSPEYR